MTVEEVQSLHDEMVMDYTEKKIGRASGYHCGSDFYIQKLDGIHTVEEVQSLHDEMVMDYTEKMRRYYRDNTNSKHINASKEYIYSHIKERITIEDLADSLGVSASYLSIPFCLQSLVIIAVVITK